MLARIVRVMLSVALLTGLFPLAPGAARPVTDVETAAAPRVVRISGPDRIATAIAISQAAFPSGAGKVVVATGYNFPDALAGAPLAHALSAPLLLTRTTALPAAALAEIQRLGAKEAIVLGGPPAVSEGVLATLRGAGLSTRRVAGPDRYATAAQIAAEVKALLGPREQVLIATGVNSPDALAAGPYAALTGSPILLARPTELVATSRFAIAAVGAKRAIVLGSEAALSGRVAQGLSGMGLSVSRVAGGDRYATAARIADHAIGEGRLSWEHVLVATGENYPDALAGGVLGARRAGPLLLTRSTSLPPATASLLSAHGSKTSWLAVLGGPPAVSQSVMDQIARLLPPPQPPSSGPGRHEESDALFRFAGGWVDTSDPAASGGALKSLDGTGALYISFEGTSVSFVGSKGPSGGIAEVTMDGLPPFYLDYYAPSPASRQVIQSVSDLEDDEHVLRLEWTGSKAASSTGTAINIDALDVRGSLLEPPNPLKVTPTRTEGHAVAETVETSLPQTLVTTDDRGTEYRLEIPAEAVDHTIIATMTPVASIAGFPLSGGLVGGVELEPEGLFLLEEATLTITPQSPVSGTVYGYAYEEDGAECHLRPTNVVQGAVVTTLDHFSGHGAGRGTSTDAGNMIGNQRPSDPQRDWEQRSVEPLTEQQKRERLDALWEHAYFSLSSAHDALFGRTNIYAFDNAFWQTYAYFLFARKNHLETLHAERHHELQEQYANVYEACASKAYEYAKAEKDITDLARMERWFRRARSMRKYVGTHLDYGMVYRQQELSAAARYEVEIDSTRGWHYNPPWAMEGAYWDVALAGKKAVSIPGYNASLPAAGQAELDQVLSGLNSWTGGGYRYEWRPFNTTSRCTIYIEFEPHLHDYPDDSYPVTTGSWRVAQPWLEMALVYQYPEPRFRGVIVEKAQPPEEGTWTYPWSELGWEWLDPVHPPVEYVSQRNGNHCYTLRVGWPDFDIPPLVPNGLREPKNGAPVPMSNDWTRLNKGVDPFAQAMFPYGEVGGDEAGDWKWTERTSLYVYFRPQ